MAVASAPESAIAGQEPANGRDEETENLWINPELLAEVHYAEVTSDGRLRHASFEGLREAEDVSGRD